MIESNWSYCQFPTAMGSEDAAAEARAAPCQRPDTTSDVHSTARTAVKTTRVVILVVVCSFKVTSRFDFLDFCY